MRPRRAKSAEAFIEAAVRGELDEARALRLCNECPEVVVSALTKRLRKYAECIFTFLDYADVPFENNFMERQIRPAVIIRKNSQSNRSERGATTQAILMSVYRTLRLRGLNPTKTIATPLRTYLLTGQLPRLPIPATANG